MKSLIVYASQSGNTKKLAMALYANLKGEKTIHPVDQAPDPNGYDLVLVGFWLQAGKPEPKTAEFLKRLDKTPVFLFATHGAAPDSEHAANAMAFAASLAAPAKITGSFSCQGEVNPRVLEKVKAKPEPPAWIDDAPSAVGHPDQQDIDAFLKAFKQAQKV